MLYIILLFTAFAVVNPFFSKRHYKLYLFFIVCGLSILAFFIVPSSSMDLYRYNNTMNLYREVGWKWVLDNEMGSNPLAAVFLYLVSCLNDNRFLPMIAVFVTYSFSLALLYKAGKRYGATRTEMNLALLFFLLNFNYYYAIDVVRIYMCFAVMAYFLYVDIVERKHGWLCWLVYFGLCYMHYAVLVLVAVRLLFVFTRRLKGLYRMLSFLCFPIILFVGYKVLLSINGDASVILSVAIDKLVGYQSYETFGIWQFLASVFRLLVCAVLCMLATWICTEIQKKMKYSKSKENICNKSYIINVEHTEDFSVFCLYFILTVFVFVSNYQFILRMPYFVQILMSAVLLFLLTQLRTAGRNYYIFTYLVLGAESLVHFCYLLIYVYKYAVFQLP